MDAQYQVKMKIQDLDTQQIVFEGNSDNGTFDLLPHESSVASWNEPFSSWSLFGHSAVLEALGEA